MNIPRLIPAALIALAPVAAFAQSPQAPVDCVDGAVSYSLTVAMGGGLTYTEADQPATPHVALLVSCRMERAVRVRDLGGPREMDFFDTVAGLQVNHATFTFGDVAEIARAAGYDAQVVDFDRRSCICRGDWKT